MRPAIDLEMPTEEVLAHMAEGDPAALHILTEILIKNQVGPQIVLDMDDMNIRGKQISAGVQDVCRGDIKMFASLVYQRSPILVNEINKEIHSHRAVESGASDVEESER